MPICTIVVPCYNQTEYLAECLASIVGQLFRDWEAIVVDDGSSRGDVGLVVAGIGDPRLRCVRHEMNRGLAAARNTGISTGSGEFILNVDSDDRIEPTYLSRLVPALVDDPATDCIYPDFQLIGAGEGIRRFSVKSTRDLLREQWLPGPGCLLRRSLWQRVGGFCEASELRPGNEDWDLYLAAAEADFVPRHLPEPLYHYRLHPESMSTRLRYVDHQTREFIYRRHRALFDRYEAGPEFLAEGYFRSAESSLEREERRRAIRLVARGWAHAPANLWGIRIALKALTPAPVVKAVKQGRDRWRSWQRGRSSP